MKKIILVLALIIASSVLPAQDKAPERMHPALLVIDIQQAFLFYVDDSEKEVAMYMINDYIELFRKNGFPVIRIYQSAEKYGLVPGIPEFEFPEDVKVLPDDPMIIKTYSNAFNKTELEKILRDKGCNTVFLCGLSSVGCVLATWFGAQDYDFKPFLLKDALMSHNADFTNQVENIFDAIGSDALQVMLDNAER